MSAVNQASAGSPYRVPPEPRRWSAILLAVAMHALLLAFLWFGISWQNNQPVAVEAEVWDMKVQAAAPPPPPPQQAEPEPEPEPAPPPPQKVIEPPAPPAPPPDIKLEQEKKRKEELRKEELRQEELRKEELRKELAEEKKAKAREEAKAKELAKKEAEKQAKEDAAKKDAERKAQELADKKEAAKQAKLEKAAKAKAEAAEKARADAIRKQDMQRMMAQAGNGTSGTAEKSTAPRSDSGYTAAITAKIKSTTTYPGSTDVPGNPKVSFKVEQLPTGEIISVRKTKSSGVPAFDDAVEKGIIKSSPLPKKKDGTVERSLVVDFSMKDLD
jgi:colicin import membrane protein